MEHTGATKAPYNFIDLFAGAGGLSEGFIQAGFSPIAHVEMNPYAAQTLETRTGYYYLKEQGNLDIYFDYIKGKISRDEYLKSIPEELLKSVCCETMSDETLPGLFDTIDDILTEKGIEKVDVIIGGPPCQAYSLVGRAQSSHMENPMATDPRNDLYKLYAKFLKKYQPKMFVFENVMGIQTARDGGPFRDLQERVRALGYEIEAHEQVASNYDVLQHRHRMIIVGWRLHDIDGNPTDYHYPELNPHPTRYAVKRDLLSDLPDRRSGEGKLCEVVQYTRPASEMQYLEETGIRSRLGFTTQHVARTNNENDREIYTIAINKWLNNQERLNYATLPERLQHHKNKQSFLNRFCVVNPDGCCHTVVAHIAMDGHYYIYPTENPTVEQGL